LLLCVAVYSRQLGVPVLRVPTAAPVPRLYGAAINMATPSATPAAFTSSCTTSVSSAVTSRPQSLRTRRILTIIVNIGGSNAVASTRVQGWGDEPCKPTVRLPD